MEEVQLTLRRLPAPSKERVGFENIFNGWDLSVWCGFFSSEVQLLMGRRSGRLEAPRDNQHWYNCSMTKDRLSLSIKSGEFIHCYDYYYHYFAFE